MDLFETAVDRVIGHEGGFSNHPQDRGGATGYGISIVFAGSINLDLDGDGKTTVADILALTRGQAVEIYRAHFWDKNRCGEMPAGIGYAVFDGAVNQGRQAVRLLQGAIGALTDGVVGPRTLARLAAVNDRADLLERYCAGRGVHYHGLDEFGIFGKGWMRRLLGVHHAAACDLQTAGASDLR